MMAPTIVWKDPLPRPRAPQRPSLLERIVSSRLFGWAAPETSEAVLACLIIRNRRHAEPLGG